MLDAVEVPNCLVVLLGLAVLVLNETRKAGSVPHSDREYIPTYCRDG